jgi:hypothetical protein
MAKPSIPGRPVHHYTLLRLFKGLGFEKMIIDGTVSAGKPFKSTPVPSGHHQPPGTLSETVPYSFGKGDMALCHQFRKPDGTIGASGKPDPKMIRCNGKQYFVHNGGCQCKVCAGSPEDWKSLM